MASTGLRLNECLGLTVDRVDFIRKTIRVDRQLVGVGFGATEDPGLPCERFRCPRA